MTASQQPTYTKPVVSSTDADLNYSPWLPPTEAEYAQATAEVDQRKHPGALWWDGTQCTLIRDEPCTVGFSLNGDRGDYVERVARHLAWHNRGAR